MGANDLLQDVRTIRFDAIAECGEIHSDTYRVIFVGLPG
jgi:hypothetical protein